MSGATVAVMAAQKIAAAGGTARTSVASDNFNRAAPLGANWAQTDSFDGSMTIQASTAARGGNGGPINANAQSAVWVGTGTFTGNQYSSIVLGPIPNASSSYNIGCTVLDNNSDNNRSHYGISLAGDSATGPYTVTLYKNVNQSYTSLFSATVAFTTAGGDELSIEVDVTNHMVHGCKNGVRMGGSWSQPDSSLTTGKPGICGGSDGSIQATADSWEGGTW